MSSPTSYYRSLRGLTRIRAKVSQVDQQVMALLIICDLQKVFLDPAAWRSEKLNWDLRHPPQEKAYYDWIASMEKCSQREFVAAKRNYSQFKKNSRSEKNN